MHPRAIHLNSILIGVMKAKQFYSSKRDQAMHMMSKPLFNNLLFMSHLDVVSVLNSVYTILCLYKTIIRLMKLQCPR